MAAPENHHVLWPSRLHRAQKPSKILRENQWLKPPMHEDIHESLHRHIAMVAVPSYFMAMKINQNFEPVEGNYIRTVDRLLFAIDDMKNDYRINSIERHIAEVMLIGVDSQIMYIKEGLWVPNAN